MATSNCTLGNRFAESKFLAKTIFNQMSQHSTEHSLTSCLPLFDTYIAELMETLRLHMNAVLRLPLPVQKRSRLLRNYWEVEYLVKEIRLQLEPLAQHPADLPTAVTDTTYAATSDDESKGATAKQNQAENLYMDSSYMNPP